MEVRKTFVRAFSRSPLIVSDANVNMSCASEDGSLGTIYGNFSRAESRRWNFEVHTWCTIRLLGCDKRITRGCFWIFPLFKTTSWCLFGSVWIWLIASSAIWWWFNFFDQTKLRIFEVMIKIEFIQNLRLLIKIYFYHNFKNHMTLKYVTNPKNLHEITTIAKQLLIHNLKILNNLQSSDLPKIYFIDCIKWQNNLKLFVQQPQMHFSTLSKTLQAPKHSPPVHFICHTVSKVASRCQRIQNEKNLIEKFFVMWGERFMLRNIEC